MPYRPGLNIITLQKARTVWLGQTVNASFACAVSGRAACLRSPCKHVQFQAEVQCSLVDESL
jgi:hypothetical protein